MATNWAKDGLDAYLALTGEKRAQDKAESDKAYQSRQLTLAENADARAATSAGLNNQLAGLQVDEATAKNLDRKSIRTRAANYIRFKQMASIPGLDDTEGLAAAEDEAHSLLYTADLLKKMPAGRVPFQVSELPEPVQKTIMNGPHAAAQQRTGQKHTDAQGEYTMTGQLGNVYVEKADNNGPALVVPTMLAKRADGTVFEVPFTPGRTNKGDEPVTSVTSDQIFARGASTLTAIKNAKTNGTHPADESAAIIERMMSTMSDDELSKWMNDDRAKSMTRAETAQYDESVAKAAAPYLKLVSELKGTAAEKETQFLAAIKGAPRAVVSYLKDNAEVSSKLFEPAAKREDAKLKAEEDRAQRERENKRDNETRREGFRNRENGGGTGEKEWALLQKKAAALVRAGKYENEDQAMADLLQPDKKGADSEIYKATLKTLMEGNEKELNPKKKMTLEEMIQKANEAADSRPKGRGATPKPSALPQKRPLSSFSTGSTGVEAPLSQRLGLTF